MMRWKKIGFGIWLAAVLAMAGCGARDAAAEAMGEAIPVEPIDGHQKELKELRALSEKTQEKTGTVFRIYYDNTRSMMGYVAVGDGNNVYVNLLDAALDQATEMLDAGKNGLERMEAYVLTDLQPDNGINEELAWTQVDVEGSLHNYFMTESFYTGSHEGHREGTLDHTYGDGTVKKAGPLTRLFLDGNNPFEKDGLTVVVSDLMEQEFDLNTICDGIIEYCRKTEDAAVCIMACKSPFAGQLSVPVFSDTSTGSKMVSVENYEGDAAFYYIITGPDDLVEAYCDGIRKKTGEPKQAVWCLFCRPGTSCYAPLTFEAVRNTMAGITQEEFGGTETETPDGFRRQGQEALLDAPLYAVWGSANVNGLAAMDGRENAFCATMGPGMGSCGAFGSRMLVSAYADLPEGLETAFGEEEKKPDAYRIVPSEACLYERNGQDWVLADKNVQKNVQIRFETVKGPVEEHVTGDQLLAAGRRVAYLRVMVDGSTEKDGGLLKDGTDYLLTVPVHLAMRSAPPVDAAALDAFSANVADYRVALEGLAGENTQYFWLSSSEQARQEAAAQFCRTPKLGLLTQRLENFFGQEAPADYIAYVDYLFRVSTKSRR